MFTARHRSLPPTRTEDWTIEDRPRRLVRPIGIRKALGCRQAGRVQRGPPQSGPGRSARILAELRECLRARHVGTRGADTITRIGSFGIGQSPARAALAIASGTGIGHQGANGGWVGSGRSGVILRQAKGGLRLLAGSGARGAAALMLPRQRAPRGAARPGRFPFSTACGRRKRTWRRCPAGRAWCWRRLRRLAQA